MQVNILEAKTHLSQILKEVQAGKDVVIAHRGKPVARLIRVGAGAPVSIPKAADTDGGFLSWLRTNPLPAHALRSPEVIEAALRDEADAWD